MSDIEENIDPLDVSNIVIKKKHNKSSKKTQKTLKDNNTSVVSKSYNEQKEALSYFITKVKDIIKNYMKYLVTYKRLDILSINEFNIVNQELELIFTNILNFEIYNFSLCEADFDYPKLVVDFDEIIKNLSGLFKQFGCFSIDDYFFIEHNFLYESPDDDISRSFVELFKNNFHPIKINVVEWEKNNIGSDIGTKEFNKLSLISEDDLLIYGKNFESLDLCRVYQSFNLRVYGMRTIIHLKDKRQSLICDGIVDDNNLDLIENSYVIKKITDLKEYIHNNNTDDKCYEDNKFLDKFCDSLTIKDLIIYSIDELNTKYIRFLVKSNKLNSEPVSDVVTDFCNDDLYNKRCKLINLLIKFDKLEYQFLAYLLYDLLSSDVSTTIETNEQNIIYESFPWQIKKYFKNAMKQTVDYTSKLCNYEVNVPLEQQICLLKANDSIKQKAMIKLKEVKSKNDDSGSKARQWLDGLLKIPFGVYKEEPLLKLFTEIKEEFEELTHLKKQDTNLLFINNFISDLISKAKNNEDNKINSIEKLLLVKNRAELKSNILFLNNVMKQQNANVRKSFKKMCHSGKKIDYMFNEIKTFIKNINNDTTLVDTIYTKLKLNNEYEKQNTIIKSIQDKSSLIDKQINEVDEILDNSVYGHNNAKRQIKRIIGQWITGESEQSGYCFGFEGPPGVGKTSLAKKGLSNCLKDNNGESRPFGFIAIGGSNNASTLSGHNYTYVGSTWGRIVDILMEKKCMNPIIFIDELDKVSQTEYGKEIVSILTHLVDSTQNDTFHDKYFSGIDIDLSRALFIFSYNDASLIDTILLDRIHRIKFQHLTLDDKLVIIRKHMLPELYKKTGIDNIIEFSDDVLKFIIEEYTCEPGVRKLKEILFEIVSEINLSILQKNSYEIPIIITKDDVSKKYLKERRCVNPKKIHENPEVGVICGLWANGMGQGGIIPIQTKYYLAPNLLELKLTGMQGDVMKESMTVAKTLAWSLCSKEICSKNVKIYEETKCQGLHIHCPEGATPKDGPSAGTAITVAIHSLLNGYKIKNNIAITGEINLQGCVTAIGGLDLKIMGGIKAGVIHFIFPKENQKDFDLFKEKYEDKIDLTNITFTSVSNIKEVLDLVYVF